MNYKKVFLFLANLISFLYAAEGYFFQPLSRTEQISFFAQNFLKKDLIYGLVGGVGFYVGIKLLRRKFPLLKHDAIKYLCASPFIFFSFYDACLLKTLNVSNFNILKNEKHLNDIEKKFLSIRFENYIVSENAHNFNSEVIWYTYEVLKKNKISLFNKTFFEKVLEFFISQKQWTRAQAVFSDFLSVDKRIASKVFNEFDENTKMEILSVLEKLNNLEQLNLNYDDLKEIKDKKKLFNILLKIKDATLKLQILNTFSVDDISALYQNQKEKFCSLISSFSIKSFESIHLLFDIFEKLFSIYEINELDFLKCCEFSQTASLLSCFPIQTIIKLAKTFSEKLELLKKINFIKWQEVETRFKSLETFMYEQLPKDKEKKLVSWFFYVRTEHYKKDSNPYEAEGSQDQKANDEVLQIEKMISNKLQEKSVLRKTNYDREKINFFVYFVLSFQHIMTSEDNKFLPYTQYQKFKELGSSLVELLIEEDK